jgi:hypothetical protein
MRAGAGSDDRAPGRSPCGAGSEDRSKLRRVLSKVTRDYWVGNEVEVLEYPTAIEFMRRAVCAYRPVIIRGLMDDWRAMEYWDLENMNELMKDAEISVNLTPDGLADAVKSVPTDNGNEKRVFTYPYECTMPFSTFYRMMEEPEEDDAVPYLSEQNDNLRQKFQQVVNDVPSSLPLVDEVFGNPETEAINLWIGDERSVTSLHKDHFEVSSVVSCYCLCFTTAIPILFVQNIRLPLSFSSVHSLHLLVLASVVPVPVAVAGSPSAISLACGPLSYTRSCAHDAVSQSPPPSVWTLSVE